MGKMIEWLKNLLFKEELEYISELKDEQEQLQVDKENMLIAHKKDRDALMKQIGHLQKELNDLSEEVDTYIKEVNKYKAILEAKEDEEFDEKFWNSKQKKVHVIYRGRPFLKYGNVDIDVRQFICPEDSMIPKIINKKGDDAIALSSLIFVINNIKYVGDKVQHGATEYWQFPFETIKSGKGDCDDGAILLYNIMVKSGIPYWKVRLNAGNVKGGGHAYVTYLADDGEWYIMDWCYWANESVKSFKNIPWQDRDDNYWDIWFSWNEKYCFYKPPIESTKSIQKGTFKIKK